MEINEPGKNTHGKLDLLDLENSIPLNPKEMPAKRRKLAAKVKLLTKHVYSIKAFTPSKRLPELDALALQNILTNLLLAAEKNKVLAYSRRQNSYQTAFVKKYGYKYYSFNRYMNIINGLIASGLVYSKNGYYDKLLKKGRNSRMMLSDASLNILDYHGQSLEWPDMDLHFVAQIGNERFIADHGLIKTRVLFPSTSVILKKDKHTYLNYVPSKKTDEMDKMLHKYNKFIQSHMIMLPIEIWEGVKKELNLKVELGYFNREDLYILETLPNQSEEDGFTTLHNILTIAGDDDQYIIKEVPETLPAREGLRMVTLTRRRADTEETGNIHERDKATATDGGEYRAAAQPPQASEASESRGAITGRNSPNTIICKPLQCQLYRVFSRGDFEHGGRFYGAEYQLLPGDKRKTILIDGMPVVEADYSSFHTRMLFHMKGIDFNGDPYDLYSGDKDMRAAVKLMTNIAISAKTRTAAIRAFINELRETGDEPVQIKSALQSRKLKATDLYNKIAETHPGISALFGSDSGIRLQYLDSQIASDILTHFTRRGVPCLCVHDSFIVTQQHKDELVDMMKDSYRKQFKFDPVITIK